MKICRIDTHKIMGIIPIKIIILFFNDTEFQQCRVSLINHSLVKLVERHTVFVLVEINPALVVTNFLFQRMTYLNS